MSQSQSQTTTPHSNQCHFDGVLIFDEPFKLYAGSYKGRFGRHYDLLINLVSDTHGNRVNVGAGITGSNLPPSLEELVDEVRTIPMLRIDWPDFGIPRLKKEHWERLYMTLATEFAGKSVYVFCHGGHGRTGTFITIMAHMAGALPEDTEDADSVANIRAAYCKKAVESNEQMDYIEDMTGLIVRSAPAKVYTSSGSSGKGGSQGSWQGGVYGSGSKGGTHIVHKPSTEKTIQEILDEEWDQVDPSGRPLNWPKDWYR